MKIKEITVSAKKSRNFQTYEVSIVSEVNCEVNDEGGADDTIRVLQAKCRKLVTEQLNLDMKK